MRVLLVMVLAPIFTGQVSVEEPLSQPDARLVREFLRNGDAQLALAEVASRRGQHIPVRSFAVLMLEERGRMQQELRAFGAERGVAGTSPAPVKPPLLGLRGEQVDWSFVTAALPAVEEDVQRLARALTSADHPWLRRFAEDALPVLRKHADHAWRIGNSLREGGTGAITSDSPPPSNVTVGEENRESPAKATP